MADTDLIALRVHLLAVPAETELLEFKTAGTRFDIDDPGRYFSDFSNKANPSLARYSECYLSHCEAGGMHQKKITLFCGLK